MGEREVLVGVAGGAVGAGVTGVVAHFLCEQRVEERVKQLARNLLYRVAVSNPAAGGEMYSDLWVLSGHAPLGGAEYYDRWVKTIYVSADYVKAIPP